MAAWRERRDVATWGAALRRVAVRAALRPVRLRAARRCGPVVAKRGAGCAGLVGLAAGRGAQTRRQTSAASAAKVFRYIMLFRRRGAPEQLQGIGCVGAIQVARLIPWSERDPKIVVAVGLVNDARLASSNKIKAACR